MTNSLASPDAPRRRCLIVRPSAKGAAGGGDEVVYRRSIDYIARFMALDILELAEAGRPRQILEILKGSPPETTRYLNPSNHGLLRAALLETPYDIVCFFNEVTFPFLSVAKALGVKALLAAHNVHSQIALTDPSLIGRLMAPIAIGFERRWYADPEATLVCISKTDIAALRTRGLVDRPIFLAPPGAPAAAALSADAAVLPEMVLTGSYAWWRKRRDLKAFAGGAPIRTPIWASDPIALQALGGQGRAIDGGLDWSAGLRFGLITDRFQGGFKLKSTEYIARNCIVLSFCDLSPDFEGLPHAEEFVRTVGDKAEVQAVIDDLRAAPRQALVGRFLEFKSACLARYDWSQCLRPLRDAIEANVDLSALGATSGPPIAEARRQASTTPTSPADVHAPGTLASIENRPQSFA